MGGRQVVEQLVGEHLMGEQQVDEQLVGDYFNDKQFKRGFQEWLNARWKEKDDVLAQWQAAYRAVTYTNSSDTPNTSNRTISFQVNDGALNSNLGTQTVSVAAVNDAPVVTTAGGTTAATEQVAVAIDPTVTVTDPDNTTLVSGTISITGNFQSGQDVLALTVNAADADTTALTAGDIEALLIA